MPGLQGAKLRPGGKARPRCGKDGYGGMAGGRGTGHGSAESESWQTTRKPQNDVKRRSSAYVYTINGTMCALAHVVGSRQRGHGGGRRVLPGAGDGHGRVRAVGRRRVPLLLLRLHAALGLRRRLLGRRDCPKIKKKRIKDERFSSSQI